MAFEFRLPDIGEGLTEATVIRWLVPVGGSVGMDEAMVEMETDKAVVEIPAPRAGIVLYHAAAEGATIAVDEVLFVVGDPGEGWAPGALTGDVGDVEGEAGVSLARTQGAGALGGASRTRTQPEVSLDVLNAANVAGRDTRADAADPVPDPASPISAAAAPIVGTLEEAERIDEPQAPWRPQALPLVRRLAASLGVDLASVPGSGPGGQITRPDVEAAARVLGPVERVRMSPIRLAIARNLTRSWQEIPHVTTYGEADAEPLLAERKRLGDEFGLTVPLEALLMRLLVPLLQEHPEFNAAVDGDDVLYRKAYDIGFAVDTRSGLMVAVVRDVERRLVEAIAVEITRLATAAKERKISAVEMRGATFTLSNIGAVGGRFGTPIIPHGTSAILSVGRADPRPVVRGGELEVGREFPLSLSYDHRIIDGAKGRAFMASLIASIEEGS